METINILSPLGIIKITGDVKGISKIHIVDQPIEITNEIPEIFKIAVSELQEYFDGKRTKFTFKINPIGTEFQKKIWQELINIPFGKTCSYIELSKKIGDAKAIRAVAAANGKNPLWIVIPCHRVIGTNGSLTGYAGGLWRKKWLLEHENPSKQESLF
ncbi:methylated-DNA--[protein]-cysteine S-methyltransferase [Flavobacterium sp. HXWNR69]|uniref:Methylated-DNA--protein-cysteine methyltransferase n=1 Tax=Flavobacterium fragile TaxID=2949085 RepID=A0ABT0TF96_9FLAO|nr:methylated-DNA--[protein]-cysteine S-methyltransferase [Flavobacterium sp. HXWNR69]MCL9769532.1 methylated-DNA--[protein]-cysteine S-methyltransferase [Flavobacterium sp. HXWNR69]